MTLAAGQTIGQYRVVEQVGRGGMATVYKAHQASLARYVALKVLPAYLAEDEGFAERFRSEAVTIAKLRHPNILQVFDHGDENGVRYIVSEFVDGGTLADQIGAPLPVDYVVQMLRPVASALDYAHARDVVHRDVKPSNVLLARDGTAVLSDFGLAKMMTGAAPRLTRTGAVVGTPEYMSPEQAMGEDAGAASDRYALAVIAYEMLTGSVPFSADTPLATLLAHVHKPLPLPRERNAQVSPAVEAALLKGLAREPAERYASSRELIDALAAAGGQPSAAAAIPAGVMPPPEPFAPATTPVSVTTPAAPVAAPSRGPDRRLVAVAAVILVLLLAGLAVARLLPGNAPAPTASAPAASAGASAAVTGGALGTVSPVALAACQPSPAPSGTAVGCRFSQLPAGATASFTAQTPAGAVQPLAGRDEAVGSDGTVLLRIVPGGGPGTYKVSATAGGVTRVAQFDVK